LLRTLSCAKRLLRVGCLAAVALVVTATSAGSLGGSTAKEGGAFRMAIGRGVLNTIDPALVDVPGEALFLSPACGSLMSYTGKPPTYRLRPDLAAAEPVVSRDGRSYTFTIRKDAHFSSGAPVLARDIVRTLERILTPAMQTPIGPDFADIVGAQDMLDGKATRLTGAIANGRTLRVRLTKRTPDFLIQMSVCITPASLPVDPEGAKAPIPSPAPYYVAQYVPDERLVLARNRFYKGKQPHHVDRFVAELGADVNAIIDDIATGKLDWGSAPATMSARAGELKQRYGINKSRFYVVPGTFVRMFVLNTSRPLFRNNPKLRQAVNFAADRRSLTRELGTLAGTPTDQYLTPLTPGYRNDRIYPLSGPDLRRARALARGRTRGGKAVLYTTTNPLDVAQAQVLQRNLAAIGLDVEIKPQAALAAKLDTAGEPFDIARIAWGASEPSILNAIFHGRTIGQPGNSNWSYFNSPKYNRLLDRAARLTGDKRYRAYRALDLQLSRDAAPAMPITILNAFTFVSARVGCVVVNPNLNLTAVCLK
jgi:peptide/nickel transport system substrate-binding protein